MTITGRIGDRPWTVTLPVANAAEGKGLSKVWARRKIADAEIARTMRQATPEDADKSILTLALEHQLVTRLTSLVAVDKTPARPAHETLKLTELPINLPAGWDFEKVFGERPKPGVAPEERRADATGDGRVQLAMAKRSPIPTAAPKTVSLPKTATDAEIKMIAGDGPAGARSDPARVHPASRVRTLMPDGRELSPAPSHSARGQLRSPRWPRAQTSLMEPQP